MNRTFTYSRAYFRSCRDSLVVVSCILIASTVVPMLLLRTPRALVFVLPVGAFWSILVWVSWYYLRGCWMDKITFCDGEMEITRAGSPVVVGPQCELAEWEFAPDEVLVILLGSDGIRTIEFDRFDKELRAELIRACHDAIPHEVQRGWIPDFDSPQQRRRYAAKRWAHRLCMYTVFGWFLSAMVLAVVLGKLRHDLDAWHWGVIGVYALVGVLLYGPVWWGVDRLVERKWPAPTQDEPGPPQG